MLGKLTKGRYYVDLEDIPDGLVPTDEPRFEQGLVVLPVSSPWMVLAADGLVRGLAPPRQTADEADPRRWIAFVRADEDDDEQDHARAALSFAVPDGVITRTETGYAGEGWSLEPHPTTRSITRVWTWIDPITWPGSALRIRHGRSHEEVRAWLARHTPLPYEETATDLFEDGDTRGPRGHLAIHDGMIELLKLYGTREALGAVEGGLLREIAGGALGPVVWDVTDEDWHAYLAAGDDAASLGRYLDPASDEAIHRAQRRALITPYRFEVAEAEARLDLLRAIAAELALGEVSSADDFVAHLAARATADLPRSWLLRVHPKLADDLAWLVDAIYRAQPRLRLSWQVA